MTVPSTLTDIRTKFRRITATPSNTQFADSEIDKYINTYYVQDFPEHVRLFNLKETYSFMTYANIDAYDFPRNSYLTISPPVYIAGYQSFYSQSRDQFYRLWPNISFIQTVGQGANIAGPYTFPVTNSPILRAQVRFNGTFDSNIVVSASDLAGNSVSMIDDGQGNLVESIFATLPPSQVGYPIISHGTVDYLTGTFSNFTFFRGNLAVIVPGTASINISTVPYVAGRSTSTLFFDDKIILRPVPDQPYLVEFDCFKAPTELLGTLDSPELNEWWQVIALGASLKFFEDQGNLEDYARYLPLHDKYQRLALRRTLVQQTNQRTSTIYEDQSTAQIYQNFFNRF